MGQGVNNCASATMVAAATLSLDTAPVSQAGWAPLVVRRMVSVGIHMHIHAIKLKHTYK